MRVLITGICGFAGSVIATELRTQLADVEIVGVDNLSRPGSEINRQRLKALGIRVRHGDIRMQSDLESLPRVDWVIDTAANPSVLAGISGITSSRQLVEHNLGGTLEILELCARQGAGLVMLSTSRVYSIERMSMIPVAVQGNRFVPTDEAFREPGFSAHGVGEEFATDPPLSLYGAAKRASEVMILEYARAFGFPAHINRCGMLSGAGQFGKADQGIISYWIHACCWNQPLTYVGFDGAGHQVRDCLHPRDLACLIAKQISGPGASESPLNVSGGIGTAISLAELTEWCQRRWGRQYSIGSSGPRRYDVGWLVLDSSRARARWDWEPVMELSGILEEIASHAESNPGWLELSSET